MHNKAVIPRSQLVCKQNVDKNVRTINSFSMIYNNYLQQEIERIQARSMRILGLDRNYLPSLSCRRELATVREIRRIQAEPNHPCHSLLPDPREHPYELRQNNLYTVSSKTERHKQSFIARSIKYI